MMRKLLMATSVLLIGCETTSPRDVSITASAAASTVRIGESVPITVTVFNQSDADINVAGYDCERPFDVLDLTRKRVGPAPPQVCSLALMAPTIVAPGAFAEIQTTWSGDATNGPADEVVYVSPGVYSIRPRLLIDDVVVYGASIPIAVTQ